MLTDDELKEIWRKSPDGRCRGFFKNDKKTIWKQARNYCAIVYLDSFDSLADFYKACENSGLMMSVSPLHDRDLKEDGSLKKPHFHVMIRFAKATATPYKAYLAFVRAFGEDSFARFQPVDDLGGCIRYHTHKGIHDKAQYNQSDIKDFGGFNSSVYFYDDINENLVIRDLTKIVLENNYTHWIELYKHTIVFNLPDLENALNTNRNVKDSIFKILRDNEYINRFGTDGFYQVAQIVDKESEEDYNNNRAEKDIFLQMNYRINR